jgi:hypothetical protein
MDAMDHRRRHQVDAHRLVASHVDPGPVRHDVLARGDGSDQVAAGRDLELPVDAPLLVAGRLQGDRASEVHPVPEEGLPVTVEDLHEERVTGALIGGAGVLCVSYGDAEYRVAIGLTSIGRTVNPEPRVHLGASRQFVVAMLEALPPEALIDPATACRQGGEGSCSDRTGRIRTAGTQKQQTATRDGNFEGPGDHR